MQTSRDQSENGLYGYAEEPAVTQIAAKGFCIFTGSSTLLDARVGVKASSPDKTHGLQATILIKNALSQLQRLPIPSKTGG
jgi:hypothetical protein